MMKKITFLLILLTVSFGYSQTLPLDFEDPLDDNWSAFNGTVATVVTDPTNSGNKVLEMVGSGVDFDGASINLATYIDLSDDNNNTITFQMWAPDATSRTHLLKIEASSNGNVELFFNTTVSGWQTINVNFGPGLANDYPIMTIFTDSGSGNTATGTYYIDDIAGPNGAAVPVDPIPSGPAPEATAPNGQTYSIYNDTQNYTNIFPVVYSFGTLSGEPDLDAGAAVNKALKFNFGVAGWGQGEALADVSGYGFVSFNYWAGAGLIGGFEFVLISNSGGVTEHSYKIGVNEPLVKETWVKVEIPMSYFTGIGFASTALFQWKFSPLNNSVDNAGIVYADNILITQNSTLATKDFKIAGLNVYPNPTQNSWTVKTQNIKMSSIQVFDILGKQVLSLAPNAIEAKIDASQLKSGLYFAKISTADGSSSLKLVRQ